MQLSSAASGIGGRRPSDPISEDFLNFYPIGFEVVNVAQACRIPTPRNDTRADSQNERRNTFLKIPTEQVQTQGYKGDKTKGQETSL